MTTKVGCFNCEREGCPGPYRNGECTRIGFERSQQRGRAERAEREARDEALRQEGRQQEREAVLRLLQERAAAKQADADAADSEMYCVAHALALEVLQQAAGAVALGVHTEGPPIEQEFTQGVEYATRGALRLLEEGRQQVLAQLRAVVDGHRQRADRYDDKELHQLAQLERIEAGAIERALDALPKEAP